MIRQITHRELRQLAHWLTVAQSVQPVADGCLTAIADLLDCEPHELAQPAEASRLELVLGLSPAKFPPLDKACLLCGQLGIAVGEDVLPTGAPDELCG